MPAPSCPQIFLKVAQDMGVDADTAGKMPWCWLELSFRVPGYGAGSRGEMLSSPEQRDAGVSSTPCGPRPSQVWDPCWEHPWVRGGVTGCGLGPTLALSPPFCQAPGEEQPSVRGGMWKQPTGSWVRSGELRPGTPELPSPCRWVPPAFIPWAVAVARVRLGTRPSKQASLRARIPLGRQRAGGGSGTFVQHHSRPALGCPPGHQAG